jgi:TolB-like protein
LFDSWATVSDPTKAVFLSYTSADAPAALRICETLRAAGVEVWLDQSELRGGDAWDAAIKQQIASCALFIPIISANTRARVEGYFRLEWKLAVDRSHLMAAERPFLLPVVIDGIGDAEALVPEKFRDVQWTRCPAGEAPRAFVERVARLLSGDEPIAPRAGLHGAAAIPGAARAPRALQRRHLLGLGVLVALAIVAAVVATRMIGRNGTIGVVAVLPFENPTADPAIEYLSDGVAESLINKLSGLQGLRVISRTSAFAFKGKKLGLTEIGRRLGVDALILGSLVQHGTSLAISAELVRVGDETQLWGEKYARQADDVLQVEGEIATTIAQTLRRELSGQDKAKLARSETSDPEAYRLYLKGRSFQVGTQQEMDKSVDYFQQAVARAPGYAMAHAGLAEVYSRQAFLRASDRTEAAGKARAAVTRALELDPDLAEAHAALGLFHFFLEWDWAGADAEYRRGLALNPGSLSVRENYGFFLTSMLRLDDGRAQSREAARLDPLAVGPIHDLAINAMVRGDYEEAAAGFRRAIDVDPNWTWGYIKLARTLALQHKCAEVLVQAEIGERRIAGGAAALARSWLGSAYATCGDRARAQQKLDELHALERTQYVDPVAFAEIHASLGEVDEALRWYAKAYDDRTPMMAYALLGARIIPALGADPRYKAITDRMHFPPPTR